MLKSSQGPFDAQLPASHATPHARRSLPGQQTGNRADHRSVVRALSLQAEQLYELGDVDSAIVLAGEAVLLAERHEALTPDLGALFLQVGTYLAAEGRHVDAVDHLAEAVELLEAAEDRLEAFARLAGSAREAAMPELELLGLENAVSLTLASFSLDDPRTLEAVVALADAYRGRGLDTDARYLFQVAIDAVRSAGAATEAQRAQLDAALLGLGALDTGDGGAFRAPAPSGSATPIPPTIPERA